MPQSLVKNLIHLVYSTKQRRPWLSKAHRDGLFAYQAGIYKEWESPALAIGGVEDHVHALFVLSMGLSDVFRPFRARVGVIRGFPRAMPWADLLRPLRGD